MTFDQDADDAAAYDRGFMSEHRRSTRSMRILPPHSHDPEADVCDDTCPAMIAATTGCGYCGTTTDQHSGSCPDAWHGNMFDAARAAADVMRMIVYTVSNVGETFDHRRIITIRLIDPEQIEPGTPPAEG